MTKLKLIKVRKPIRKRKNELLGVSPCICFVLYNEGMGRIIFLATLFLPTLAIASQVGFPSQPIWVSSSSAVEGETVAVSAIVANDTAFSLLGTLVFIANDARIGALEFELPSGKSQIHTIEWQPKKGEYQVAARIEDTHATLSQKETPSLGVVVKEPPAMPSEIERAITQVVQTGSAIASSSAPIIIQVAQTLFDQTESLRNSGIKRLENYLAPQASSPYLGGDLSIGIGEIAGTSTRNTSNTTGFDTPPQKDREILSNIAQTAASGALFALQNAALFYPILAIATLGTIYFLARRIRRQR